MSTRYPSPPWRTHGWAVFRPYLVPAAALRPPEGLAVEARAGLTLGLLGVVDYRPPSPLIYRELVWMPARVRARRADGRVARGFWVAKMLVDSEASLAAGRELWALPKQLARFSLGRDEIEVAAEDGARLRIALGRRLPGLRAASSIATLQVRDGALVRFRGETRGRIGLASMRVASMRDLDGTWQGLEAARPLGPLASELADFETIMQPPELFELA